MKAQANQNMKSVNQSDTDANTKKNKWIQTYSERMLKAWKSWQGALGVADTYIEQIKEDLSKLYEIPLERSLIENTY